MQLVFWYIFWIFVLVVAILLVSFPGWGRCDGWFQTKLIKSPDIRWLYLWIGIFILLGAIGYLGDPATNTAPNNRSNDQLWKSSYRFYYGFLLFSIFIWWMALFGGRNPAVAAIAAIFGIAISLGLAFLVPSGLVCTGYVVVAIWMAVIATYSFVLTQQNYKNPDCQICFF